MNQRFLDYSRVIAVMAQQEALDADVAVQFCKSILPQLMAELEVLQHLADTKLSSVFTAPATVEPQPADCKATICSSRWGKQRQEDAPEAPKKPRKARKRTNARRKA